MAVPTQRVEKGRGCRFVGGDLGVHRPEGRFDLVALGRFEEVANVAVEAGTNLLANGPGLDAPGLMSIRIRFLVYFGRPARGQVVIVLIA